MGVTRIQGRVIRILDEQRVIVNLGAKDGVTDNAIFNILSGPETVTDPATGQELGEVTVVKAKVKATRVYDRFTIASASWAEAAFDVAAIVNIGRQVSGKMLVDPKEVQPWKGESEIPVRIGDEVVATVTRIPEPKSDKNRSEEGNPKEPTDSGGQ